MIEILQNGKIDQPGGASDFDPDMDYDVQEGVQVEGEVSEEHFEQDLPSPKIDESKELSPEKKSPSE
jgi:hypothetical protein